MTVEKNNKVTIEYEGRFDNKEGEIFDTSEGKEPLTFISGVGMVVPGFDNAILGMEKEEEKEITLKPEEAYGERREELQQKIPRSALPQDQKPEVGMMLVMATPQGQQMPAKITGVTDEEVTIDINHPLAGKTLYFKIKLKDYQAFSEEELKKMMQPQEHSHGCGDHACQCSEDDACKTGEEDCKCNPEEKPNTQSSDSKESEPAEQSIEDLAEGK
jgi:FKBP-type peptidyl-prolyl cis-trans isomerase 2